MPPQRFVLYLRRVKCSKDRIQALRKGARDVPTFAFGADVAIVGSCPMPTLVWAD